MNYRMCEVGEKQYLFHDWIIINGNDLMGICENVKGRICVFPYPDITFTDTKELIMAQKNVLYKITSKGMF